LLLCDSLSSPLFGDASNHGSEDDFGKEVRREVER
jgi:hypothetical protein